jgi:hypothetical protein
VKTQILFLGAAAALCLAACGDDETGGGTTGNTGNTGNTATGGTGNTGGSSGGTGNTGGATGGTGNAGGGAGECADEATNAECRSCCADENPAGTTVLQGLVFQSCGCTAGGTCETECMDDPACDDPTTPPAQACQDCINGIGSTDACATSQIATCSADPDCAAALMCILSCPS